VKSANQVSALITVITVLGPKVQAIVTDIVAPEKLDEIDFDKISKVLSLHFTPKPKRLVVVERYVFNSEETISDFVVAIKHLPSSCT